VALPTSIDAFYGSCDVPQTYFFSSPFPNTMTAISVVHSLDSLQSAGVNVSVVVTNSPQLLVVINATADHFLNVDFSPLDPTYSTIQVAVVRFLFLIF
jgi:hypothetical protein